MVSMDISAAVVSPVKVGGCNKNTAVIVNSRTNFKRKYEHSIIVNSRTSFKRKYSSKMQTGVVTHFSDSLCSSSVSLG